LAFSQDFVFFDLEPVLGFYSLTTLSLLGCLSEALQKLEGVGAIFVLSHVFLLVLRDLGKLELALG